MNGPERRINAGAISATIWQNQGKDDSTYNTVSFERRYKDSNDEWKSTNSLRFNDLPKAALVLKKAYEYLAIKTDETVM